MSKPGIAPLLCGCCEQIVGVINERALAVMLATGEVYICQGCMEQDETQVEHVLTLQPNDHYAHLVSKALLDGMLEESREQIGIY